MYTAAVGTIAGAPVIVSGGWDKTARVWDLATAQPRYGPLEGHQGEVRAVAVATLEGTSVVVSGSGDRTVRVWDLATGQPCYEPLEGHQSSVLAVAVGAVDGTPVIVSGGDYTVRVWDLGTGRSRETIPVGSPVLGLTAPLDHLVVAASDGLMVVRFSSRSP